MKRLCGGPFEDNAKLHACASNDSPESAVAIGYTFSVVLNSK